MAAIKLKHASGNGTILNSPAANPSADVTLKLPSTTGTAGQVLSVASANHSATNAELEFAAVGGKFASYAIIADSKAASSSHGGTFTSGAWRTRDLNTELADADGIVSISSNQFTLQAGSYLIRAAAPAYRVNRHLIRLYNITDSSVAEEGYGSYSHQNDNSITHTFLSARITITGAKAFEIQHRCQSTEADVGLGLNMSNNINNTNDIYTIVEIYKES